MEGVAALNSKVRVVIADDHPMFRDGLRLVLGNDSAVELVGEAANGMEVVELASDRQPDVIVMDLNLPGLHGIEATRRVLADNPSIGVLVLTMFDDPDSILDALRVGARGYLLKGVGRDPLVRALLAVANGEMILGPAVARRMQAFFAAPQPQSTVFPELTPREHEVLDLVA